MLENFRTELVESLLAQAYHITSDAFKIKTMHVVIAEICYIIYMLNMAIFNMQFKLVSLTLLCHIFYIENTYYVYCSSLLSLIFINSVSNPVL